MLALLSLAGCSARSTNTSTIAVVPVAPAQPATVAAYDDVAPGPGIFARLICEGTSLHWSDIEVLGTDDGAMRLCEASLRAETCPAGAKRTVRECARESIGPGLSIKRDQVVLRHTLPLETLAALSDDVRERRMPSDASGRVRRHTAVANRDTCETLREHLEERRAPPSDAERQAFIDEQLANLEADIRDARSEIEQLERKLGKSISAHLMELRLRPRPASDEERRRQQEALAEGQRLMLLDTELRHRLAVDMRVATILRASSIAAPAEELSCVLPRSR